jgi:hypothetical protein
MRSAKRMALATVLFCDIGYFPHIFINPSIVVMIAKPIKALPLSRIRFIISISFSLAVRVSWVGSAVGPPVGVGFGVKVEVAVPECRVIYAISGPVVDVVITLLPLVYPDFTTLIYATVWFGHWSDVPPELPVKEL